jgi:hypothetical protein
LQQKRPNAGLKIICPPNVPAGPAPKNQPPAPHNGDMVRWPGRVKASRPESEGIAGAHERKAARRSDRSGPVGPNAANGR